MFSWPRCMALVTGLWLIVAVAPPASASTSWNFTVKVGLSADLVTEYGGLSALENDVNSQLATVSSRFTGFAAPIMFQANQFYVYSDDPATELPVSHSGSDFLLLYSANNPSERNELQCPDVDHELPLRRHDLGSIHDRHYQPQQYGHLPRSTRGRCVFPPCGCWSKIHPAWPWPAQR